MKKTILWIVSALGVVLLGVFGWFYFKKDELVDKLFDDLKK